ncbi:MAG: alpha/beta fold hydrolase [Salinivirgaceae bacterium]|jgi:pimeloyl-ACP methyl ester carboxylesterase|nr:alpha/beta fold hydrolase [Salinivirgaceae bacterium]
MIQKLLILSLLLLALLSCNQSKTQPNDFESIQISGENDISIRGDLYQLEKTSKPFVLLFHQAGYSRGEYRETAPWLNKMGFSCLAIDQRSGNAVNGVENETYKQAKSMGLDTDYVSALPDLRSAIEYVQNELGQKEIILVGSSYSAALVFILATEYPDKVKGLAAFSPGEYFKYNGKKMTSYAANVSCPVFITSAAKEKKHWEEIYDALKSEKNYFLPDSNGFHGSQALWSKNKGYKAYRKVFKEFLDQY